MFRVVQEISFCYGHRLLDYDGKCRNLHGHNARALVTLESESLDERGMVIDFGDIKRSLQTWIDEQLDHKMLLCRDDPVLAVLKNLGEPVFEMDVNPTAENIARLIFEEAERRGLPVVEVALWETPRSCAVYRSRA
ncbi:6-carboxytetrahydropterin synthase [Maioricimonas sp. JC845]|uniref:6-pyruvoyl trahydropterin synthase family protein n=1 Tax=Maioricimonas sp. JC845 TaxID=3232138 RepID=UPI00345A9BCD